jgi:hypothetical protein
LGGGSVAVLGVRSLFVAAALGIASPCAVAAHPLHTTLTVLTIDAKQRTITLSIRAFADDFAAAVARAAGKAVPRDSSASADDITRYVRDRFSIAGTTLVPCGVERKADAYLLCFRAALPSTPPSVRNLMLTELHADQVNIVQVTAGSTRTTRVFTRDSGVVPLAGF